MIRTMNTRTQTFKKTGKRDFHTRPLSYPYVVRISPIRILRQSLNSIYGRCSRWYSYWANSWTQDSRIFNNTSKMRQRIVKEARELWHYIPF